MWRSGILRTSAARTPTIRVEIATLMNPREEVIHWLRDAYAMECAVEASLERQASDGNLDPSVRARARFHLDETQHHADLLKACLEKMGAGTSTSKTGLAAAAKKFQALGIAFAQDERVKDLLSAYASEQ